MRLMNDEELKKQVEETMKEMKEKGHECGIEIRQIVIKLHPTAFVFASYRSAFAVEKDDDRNIKISFYGDPHANGRDITPESVKEMKVDIIMVGQRYYPNIYAGGALMVQEAEKGCPHWGPLTECNKEKDLKMDIQEKIMDLEKEFNEPLDHRPIGYGIRRTTIYGKIQLLKQLIGEVKAPKKLDLLDKRDEELKTIDSLLDKVDDKVDELKKIQLVEEKK